MASVVYIRDVACSCALINITRKTLMVVLVLVFSSLLNLVFLDKVAKVELCARVMEHSLVFSSLLHLVYLNKAVKVELCERSIV